MSWVRRVLTLFRIAPQLPTSAELERTRPRHRQTLRKADKVIEDYRRMDGAIKITVERLR